MDGQTNFLTNGSRHRFVYGVLIAALSLTAACSDTPTGARVPDRHKGELTLPAIEATGCRYGGDYPFCNPEPDPFAGSVGMGPGGMNPGTEPVTTGEGGGGGSSSQAPPMCDSRTEGCLRSLTDADRALIAAALSAIKTASEFRDNKTAELCGNLAAQLNTLFSQGRVFRGADGIPDNSEHQGASHQAQAWRKADGTSVIHVDGDALDRAEAAGPGGWDSVVADWLLHEAAHTLGYTHPGETVAPYTTEPFTHMTGGSAEQCVR